MLRRIFVVGGTGAVGALTLAIVQIRVGTLFGAGGELDAFFVGAALPSVLLAISAGAISYLVVPRLPVDDLAVASRAAGRLATTAAIAGLGLTGLLLLAAPLIVALVAPGLDSAISEEAAAVMRIYSLSIPATAAAFVISALGHNAHRGYTAGLSTALYGLVWTALLFTPPFTDSVRDVAYAGLIATGAQLLSAYAFSAPRGFHPRPSFSGLSLPGRAALTAAGAVLGATILGRLALLLDPLFGSLLDEGAVSQLSYAMRIVLLAVFAAGQGAAFSLMVVSRQDRVGTSAELRVGIVAPALLALAAAAIFLIAGPALAELLLAHGEFAAADAREVGELLRLYGPAVVVMTMIWAFEALLYSAHRAGEVLRAAAIGLAALTVASGIGVALIGIEGRPIGVLVGYLAQLAYLAPRLMSDGRLAGLRSGRSLGMLAAALAVQIAVGAIAYGIFDALIGTAAAAIATTLAAAGATVAFMVAYERRALAESALPPGGAGPTAA